MWHVVSGVAADRLVPCGETGFVKRHLGRVTVSDEKAVFVMTNLYGNVFHHRSDQRSMLWGATARPPGDPTAARGLYLRGAESRLDSSVIRLGLVRPGFKHEMPKRSRIFRSCILGRGTL